MSDSHPALRVVLTGASSGIGRATALAFAREGADLVLAARGREGLDEVAAECENTGARTLFVETGANYTGRRLRPPSPLLDPREVAAEVLALAKSPRASTGIGSVALPARMAHAVAPDIVGRVMRQLMDLALSRADPAPHTSGNLFSASQGHAIDGGWRRPVQLGASAAAVVALGALAWWATTSRRVGR